MTLPLSPSSPDTPPPQPVRWRLAALSVLGALMVALPLVQVLRYQGAEIGALMDEQAALDPVARAVDVQRGLVAHREVAGLVLRGNPAQEPQRRLRQRDVDEQVGALGAALLAARTLRWERAVDESEALREDWSQLVQGLLAQRVTAQASDAAHRLLLEQTLQVIDLVSDVGAAVARLDAQQPRAISAPVLASARALPRLAALSAAVDAGDGAAATALARAFDALVAAAAPTDIADPAQRRLAAAAAAVRASATRAAQLLRDDGNAGARAALPAATRLALQAQFGYFDAAHERAAQRLVQRTAALQSERAELLAGLLALALLTCAVAGGIGRRPGGGAPPAAAHDAAAPSGAAAAVRAERRVAGQLFQRLRHGDTSAAPAADASTPTTLQRGLP